MVEKNITGLFQEKYHKTTDDLSLYYRDYTSPESKSSKKQAVLCLAGITRNSRDFEILAERLLSLGHRVLTIDLRGRGKSSCLGASLEGFHALQYIEDIIGVLDQEKLDRVALIGTSMGGILGMILASGFPNRISALVLNDIGPEINPEGYESLRTYLARPEPEILNWEEASRQAEILLGHVYPDRESRGFWQRIAQQIFRQEENGEIHFDYSQGFVKSFLNTPSLQQDLWVFFKAIGELPILLVYGEISDFLTEGTRQKMQEIRPDMKQVKVSGIGHAPELIEIEAWSKLKIFITSLPPV